MNDEFDLNLKKLIPKYPGTGVLNPSIKSKSELSWNYFQSDTLIQDKLPYCIGYASQVMYFI